ncbi:MAG TPA: inorganic phosphate transporter [Gemmatimonadaceae bacterium]|nr:inorganic phosphate transporter [Gemmatimonadaceae bacterium]
MVAYVLLIIVVAFAFDFSNGFHDSANSIATIVGTRVLSPLAAVVWAAMWNFAAALLVGTAVAKAVSSGFVVPDIVTPSVMFGALFGAIAWNVITWYVGIPSSSSHALIGGFAGAAIAKAGFGALVWGRKWIETLTAIAVSPVLGALIGFVLMVIVFNLFRRATPAGVDRFFRRGQLLSSAAMSLAHGSNDAQKTMGIIVGLLYSVRETFAQATGWERILYVPEPGHIPAWVAMGAYLCISLGTLFGGWRIVHTMGSRITRLRPVSGFAAESAGAIVILTASRFGIPVSTTHTITGSIVGVGATGRLSAVRWGIAGRIVWAWIFTIPAAAVIGGFAYLVLARIVAP